jgi:thymidylate synthase
MAKIDIEFNKLCAKILEEGREYTDTRRDVTRLQIPSYTFRHSFKDGFPAITNKKLYWKGIVAEALWFLRGDNDVEFLNNHGVKIWNKDAYNWYVKGFEPDTDPEAILTFEEFEERGFGSVGQNYSVQWRNFNGDTDQIANLVRDMKENIMGSRLKVNAWNPSETDLTALPPCHSEFQIVGIPLTSYERETWFADRYGLSELEQHEMHPNHTDEQVHTSMDKEEVPRFGFELHWNQRSVDTFLGLPFNIASYALIAKVLEALTGYPALGIEGTLKCVHFYDNQIEAAIELVSRDPTMHSNCILEMPNVEDIEDDLDEILDEFDVSEFKLIGYTSDKGIKVEMLAPKEL